MSVARGCAHAMPVSVLLWVLIICLAVALASCQSYQPMGEEIWRSVPVAGYA